MRKIIILIITLAFLVSGCHTLFVYNTPTGYTKYKSTIIVDTYYPYYYYYPYSYYWYKLQYNYYYTNKRYYVKPYNQPKYNNEINITKERTKQNTTIRNNSGTRNTNTRKR